MVASLCSVSRITNYKAKDIEGDYPPIWHSANEMARAVMSKADHWFQIEELPQSNYLYFATPFRVWFSMWPKAVMGKKGITDFVVEHKEGITYMIFREREFDQANQYTAERMIGDPAWAETWNQRIVRASQEFYRRSEKFRRLDHSKLSDHALLASFQHVYEAHEKQHALAPLTTWFAEAKYERFSKHLRNYLADHIADLGLSLDVSEAFSILSTPIRPSFDFQQEVSLLKLVVQIQKRRPWRRLFFNSTTPDLMAWLPSRAPAVWQLIQHHHMTYCWLPYGPSGPALPIETYVETIASMVRQNENAAVRLQTLSKKYPQIRRERAKLLRLVKPDALHRRLINMAAHLVWLKGYRKDVLFHGLWCYEPGLREIGRRLGLSLRQVQHLLSWEYGDALVRRKYDSDELNERWRQSALIFRPGAQRVFTGRKAKNFIRKLKIQRPSTKNVRELQGTCAYPGRVQGVVRVVNDVADMKKMKPGDILVSHATNPNLMPAIKIAKAIVTNAGGITCHAAIVSRELGIPCVVGTGNATYALKDGIKVEVDATRGIVRKIK